MKNLVKRLLVVVVALSLGLSASAQFRAGIRAGLNVNSLDLKVLNTNFDTDNRCGFTAGVMTEFTVPVIGLCFDLSLMYTRMNSEVGLYTTNNSGEMSNEFDNSSKDFFQIPLNIKYKLGLPVVGRIITPYIYTGPDFAFRLGHSDAFKRFQVAWDLGLGVELVRHLQIGAGYSWGINNIARKITGYEGFDGKFRTRNNYWTITAAYLF